MTIRRKILITIAAAVVFSSSVATLNPQKASALSGSEFKAGRIIDDTVFFDGTSMDANQIQTFLNSKLPTCDTNGEITLYDPDYGDTVTRKVYSERRGVSTPFICLKDYKMDVPSRAPEDSLCNGITAGTQRTAAQIIDQVSRSCGVSQKALIVLLQKEQSLVTDDWPWPIQYRSATGYGCPDTAPCDEEYYGFFNQVYMAARVFKYYAKYPNSFNHISGRDNNILYNPNTNCGSSTVFIENQATAGLYNYTPYQPNAAALNNLYGTGDACSAYGNRNFWRMFSDWFGSTYAPSFSARFRAQSSSPTIRGGESGVVYMQFVNTGTAFWKDDLTVFSGYYPIHLAATNPINRSSVFKSSNWLASSRPNGTFTKVLESDGWTLAEDQHTVFPGQIAEYQFKLTVPYNQPGGTYREYFQPILEGSANFSLGVWTYLDINVIQNNDKAQYRSQSPYPTVVNGSSKKAFYQFKNVGNTIWYDDTTVPSGKYPVHLAATGPINRSSPFNKSWPRNNRTNLTFTKVFESDGTTLAANQHMVQPGQIAYFEFPMSSPINQKPGVYREYFQPIVEGAQKWDMGAVVHLDVTAEAQKFEATYKAQSAYPTIKRGQTKSVYFKYKNTGNMFWKDTSSAFPGYPPTNLATTGPINRTSAFKHSSWSSANRPVTEFTRVYESNGVTLAADQSTVQPGQIVEYQLTLSVSADSPIGTYREYFQPILEGSANWNIGGVTHLDITVEP